MGRGFVRHGGSSLRSDLAPARSFQLAPSVLLTPHFREGF